MKNGIHPKIRRVLEASADLAGLSLIQLQSKCREQAFADARALACAYLLSRGIGGPSVIGRAIHRTHNAVIYAAQRARECPTLSKRLAELEKQLEEK